MAFVPLTSGQTDADSPIDQTLMDAIRSNFDDLDSRVQGVEHSYTAGSILIAEDDGVAKVGPYATTKFLELELQWGGSLRVYFGLNSEGGQTVRAQIYKNGVAVGTLRTSNTATPVYYSEDISGLAAGDTLEIHGYAQGGNGCVISNVGFLSTTPANMPIRNLLEYPATI